MTRMRFLPALILAAAASSGCSTEQFVLHEADEPVRSLPPATPTESTPTSNAGERWACTPDQVSGFVTDPVVYPVSLSLTEVLSEISEERTVTVDSNTGRLASVTIRNKGGLIVQRLEFERSASIGWHLERGRAC